jgi:hypothetical protein
VSCYEAEMRLEWPRAVTIIGWRCLHSFAVGLNQARPLASAPGIGEENMGGREARAHRGRRI